MRAKKDIIIHADGSFFQYLNPKKEMVTLAGIGGYIQWDDKIKFQFSERLDGVIFKNYHEYYAILFALWKLSSINRRANSVVVYSDHLAAVDLFALERQAKKDIDVIFLEMFNELKKPFKCDVSVDYCKRNQKNDLAHELSRMYLNEVCKESTVKVNGKKEREIAKGHDKKVSLQTNESIELFLSSSIFASMLSISQLL